MVAKNSQDIRDRLLPPLQAEAADDLLAMVEHETVAIGALEVQLEPNGRRILRGVLRYCIRWKAEGGPHPEVRTRERVYSIADDAPLLWRRSPRDGSYKIIVRFALPDWNDPWTRHLRGLLVGVLEQINRTVDVPSRTRTARSGASLDARALTEAKKLQLAGEAWGPTEVAKRIGSSRSSLIGKKKDGKPRCPTFAMYWFEVQQERLRQQRDRIERGRVARGE